MAHSVVFQIGRKVRHRRWMMGMTQQQLGEKIGASLQEIQSYESGKTGISDVIMLEIATAMEVTMSFFFEGIGDQERHREESNAVDAVVVTHKEALELLRSYFAVPKKEHPSFFQLAGVSNEIA